MATYADVGLNGLVDFVSHELHETVKAIVKIPAMRLIQHETETPVIALSKHKRNQRN